jgi:hypothetical protein
MMVTLGNDWVWFYDEVSGSYIPGSQYIAESSGKSSSSQRDPCLKYTSNWVLSLDPTTGKCYSICAAGGKAIEVDPKECRSLIPKKPASTETGTGTGTGNQQQKPKEVNWMTQSTIISGLPNWVVVVGGAALAAVVLNN